MPSGQLEFRARCGCFLPLFQFFMLKRARKCAAMQQKTLKIRTVTGGVIVGCLLTYLFWGSFLLQCGDVEVNPGPPRKDTLRQTSLTGGRRDSTEKTGSKTTSTPTTPQPAAEPSLLDVMAMLQAMTTKFDTMEGKLDAMEGKFNSMEEKFDAMKEDIKDIHDGYAALEEEVQTLNDEIASLRRENDDLKKRVLDTERKADDLEGRSKRNNLIIYGLLRTPGETPSDCEGVVSDMIVDKLDMTGDIQFDRVHRLNASPTSPVIACCTFYKDKEKILKAKRKLKGSQVCIGEDFSYRVREIRKKLSPHLKKARSEGKRATMIFDHLLIDGKKLYLGEGENLRERE
eukprot:TRINITY_DN52698_c0_g1_i5.p1 TRINITY_DN52698_c0_g1~~TRINITY_DN52698_c0_g1_i5.p1  ORF type:complete len:344 (+),score=84.28 TRINITY_DN52698_c0_g1_i5:194-1225(+)